MKKIFCLIVITLFISSTAQSILATERSIPKVEQKQRSKKSAKYWQNMADGMVHSLVGKFWGASFSGYGKRYYFNYASNLSDMTTAHYWPQAHAMDVIVDAYMRTKDKKYLELYPLWWEGAPRFNFSGQVEDPWWNVYVDDMEWIALALIRMYESTQDTMYFKKAVQMYDQWIWPTWGPDNEAPWYGGITWKTDIEKSKNACSNGPAAIIAARIYNFYEQADMNGAKPREEYLSEAKRIYQWLRNNLYDSESGAVADNMSKDGRVNRDWIFTYNQGTFLGASHELYRITGEKSYLDDAVHAADYVINRMSNNNGVLSNATSGDGGLFHGIFFRYFVKLINENDLNMDTRRKFHSYLTHLATVMAENGINHNSMLYGGDWWQAPADKQNVGLTPHLTGCMLMEAMCVLETLE